MNIPDPNPQPESPLLVVENMTKRFGGLTAVSGFSIKVRTGELVSLIGPNGAGKTTVFNLLTGVYPMNEGNAVFDNCSIMGMKSHKIVRLGIARTFQNIRLFRDMTVLDNVRVAQHTRTRHSPIAAIARLGLHRKEEFRIL